MEIVFIKSVKYQDQNKTWYHFFFEQDKDKNNILMYSVDNNIKEKIEYKEKDLLELNIKMLGFIEKKLSDKNVDLKVISGTLYDTKQNKKIADFTIYFDINDQEVILKNYKDFVVKSLDKLIESNFKNNSIFISNKNWFDNTNKLGFSINIKIPDDIEEEKAKKIIKENITTFIFVSFLYFI